MWAIAAWASLAVATPDGPFPRLDDALSVRRYQKVIGSRARNRNSKGSFEVWAFPDSEVEHYRLWDRKKLLEQRWFNALGDPIATVAYDEMQPSIATIHGIEDHPVSVETWNERTIVGKWSIPFSAPAMENSWHTTDFVAKATWVPERLDVWAPPFEQGLLLSCGCTLVDRTTAWLEGKIGARFILYAPSASAPHLGELWAIPSDDGTLIFSYSAPGTPHEPDLAAPLAIGRAMMALTHLEGRR